LPSENEPFGRVVVEAMACGVPVIATRSGGVPEIVRHQQDGLLVPLGNDDEMAYAILKILKNETMRERFSRSAMNRSETFNLDKHIKEMTQIFDSMIER
jgi:glycosyltransferase involved in cell wall biosynthesis